VYGGFWTRARRIQWWPRQWRCAKNGPGVLASLLSASGAGDAQGPKRTGIAGSLHSRENQPMTAKLTIWTYDWVPARPRGFVRDLRLRWAAEEAGLAYGVRNIRFDGRKERGQVYFSEERSRVHLRAYGK